MALLLLDNYDSFTWNLHDLLVRASWAVGIAVTIDVVRNDATTVRAIVDRGYQGIVISPGPNSPVEAGICLQLLEYMLGRLPIFGVCLGHQAIGQVLGARLIRAPAAVHGTASPIRHDGRGVLAGLPEPLTAMRYHSLIVAAEGLPPVLEVSAQLAENTQVIMGLRATGLHAESVQFHPESIDTPDGLALASNVLCWMMRGLT